MKVYIAFQDVDWEGSNVLSVHKTKALAKESIETDKEYREKNQHMAYDGYHIEDHELED